MGWLLALLLPLSPVEGFVPEQAAPREVRRVYWDLLQTTEVSVLLLPKGPKDTPPRVTLLFQAFFPGRAKRDPYSGLPQWPKGKPQRLALQVQAVPLTVVEELSLQLVIDDTIVELAGPGSEIRYLGCPPVDMDCGPNGIEIEIDPSVLQSLTTARSLRGQALAYPVELTEADQMALKEFFERIGFSHR